MEVSEAGPLSAKDMGESPNGSSHSLKKSSVGFKLDASAPPQDRTTPLTSPPQNPPDTTTTDPPPARQRSASTPRFSIRSYSSDSFKPFTIGNPDTQTDLPTDDAGAASRASSGHRRPSKIPSRPSTARATAQGDGGKGVDKEGRSVITIVKVESREDVPRGDERGVEREEAVRRVSVGKGQVKGGVSRSVSVPVGGNASRRREKEGGEGDRKGEQSKWSVAAPPGPTSVPKESREPPPRPAPPPLRTKQRSEHYAPPTTLFPFRTRPTTFGRSNRVKFTNSLASSAKEMPLGVNKAGGAGDRRILAPPTVFRGDLMRGNGEVMGLSRPKSLASTGPEPYEGAPWFGKKDLRKCHAAPADLTLPLSRPIPAHILVTNAYEPRNIREVLMLESGAWDKYSRSNPDQFAAPRTVLAVSPPSGQLIVHTRYSANAEWGRNTSVTVQAPPESHHYWSEKERLAYVPIVDEGGKQKRVSFRANKSYQNSFLRASDNVGELLKLEA
ncbi:hypothetical protein HK104_011484 [Borealophlyctis nickersoniae]|nr:hypothetical protein HK104_011484 [Borealophlyctis nickersoniae]